MTGVKANGQNILLLSAGRRVELLNGIQAAASRLIPSAVVICADYDPAMSSACQECGNFVSLPRATDPHYPDALLALCLDRGIGLVIPTIDTELLVLAQLRDKFAISGVTLMVSDEALIAACRDKRQTSKLFHALGMPTPEIFLPNAIQFPCFSKPAGGSSSIGAFYAVFDENAKNAGLSAERTEMSIEVTTIDHTVAERGIVPNFVKIDIEGAELDALRGMTETLKKCQPVVFIEITKNTAECFALFAAANYVALDEQLNPTEELIDNGSGDKRLATGNFFFVPQNYDRLGSSFNTTLASSH